MNNPLRYTDPTGHTAVGDSNEAGCSGSGPACIIDMYGDYGDDDGMMDSLRNHVRRHTDYNPVADPNLSDEERAIVSIAMFQVAVHDTPKDASLWDILKAVWPSAAALSLFGIINEGINMSPDDNGGGGGLNDSVSQTLKRIDEGGPFPYGQDGQVFQNREGLLPQKAPGYYQEYTVTTSGASNRGVTRIVTGQNGEAYVTYDHYKTFVRIR